MNRRAPVRLQPPIDLFRGMKFAIRKICSQISGGNFGSGDKEAIGVDIFIWGIDAGEVGAVVNARTWNRFYIDVYRLVQRMSWELTISRCASKRVRKRCSTQVWTHAQWQLDAHPSGSSRTKNKQANYHQYTQLTTMDVTTDYTEHVKPLDSWRVANFGPGPKFQFY